MELIDEFKTGAPLGGYLDNDATRQRLAQNAIIILARGGEMVIKKTPQKIETSGSMEGYTMSKSYDTKVVKVFMR